MYEYNLKTITSVLKKVDNEGLAMGAKIVINGHVYVNKSMFCMIYFVYLGDMSCSEPSIYNHFNTASLSFGFQIPENSTCSLI